MVDFSIAGHILLYDYYSDQSYVIVIARGQGFMAVNEPSPRAQPEDKVCLRCHKSLATRAITVIYPTRLVRVPGIYGDTLFKLLLATDSVTLLTSTMDAQACPYDPYCLGLCEWTDCPGALQLDNTPRPTNLLVSAPPSQSPPVASHSSLSVQPESTRFKFATEEELSTFAKGLVPENTTRSTKWALNTFSAWIRERNTRYPADPVPDDILVCSEPEIINLHLSRFIVETRKSNGEIYPPSTLHQLLCGILRRMRELNPNCPNFLDKNDNRFRSLQGTLDSYFHKLHSEGIGRKVKHAEVITTDEEDQLWESGVLNVTTPRGLQNAVFFTIGKLFCLRGGKEHRALKLSQLKRDSNVDKYIYHENVSKNRNGSFKQLHVRSKVVPVYSCPEAGIRCPV